MRRGRFDLYPARPWVRTCGSRGGRCLRGCRTCGRSGCCGRVSCGGRGWFCGGRSRSACHRLRGSRFVHLNVVDDIRHSRGMCHTRRGPLVLGNRSASFPVGDPSLYANRKAILSDFRFGELGANRRLSHFVLLRGKSLRRRLGCRGFRVGRVTGSDQEDQQSQNCRSHTD